MPGSTHSTVGLAYLQIADVVSHWEDIGFHTFYGTCQLGQTQIQFAEQGEGIVAWGLNGVSDTDLIEETEGITTFAAEKASGGDASLSVCSEAHPNQTTHIDHVVLNTPDLGRTLLTLQSAGFDLRRIREATPKLHQAFFRMGEVILEVVGHPSNQLDAPASLWGFICAVPNLESTASVIGSQLGPIRDAVQPGHKIATLTRDSAIRVPLGFIAKHEDGELGI